MSGSLETGAQTRYCERCWAVLPPGRDEQLCIVCASGLGPAPGMPAETQHKDGGAGGLADDPAADSGLRCPHCRSPLSYRDVGRQLCPVCGGGTGLDSLLEKPAPSASPAAGLHFTAPLRTEQPDEEPWDMQYPVW